MKVFVDILFCATVLVSLSFATGLETVDECPFKDLEDSTVTTANILGSLLYGCVEISDNVKTKLDDANTTEEYRVVFKELCSKIPHTHDCMANVTSLSKRCLDETDLTMFNLNLELMDSGIKIVCFQDGERIAGLLGDADECLSSRDHDMAEECINGTLAEEFSLDLDDMSEVSLQPYRAMLAVRKCLLENSDGCKRSVVEEGEDFINEFLSKMRCIGQATGEIVQCGLLENNNSSSSTKIEIH